MPYTINAKLREAKYGQKGNTKLTAKQIRELTGYFESQRRKVDVRNLCPYELWKGDQAEPEDMQTGQTVSVNYQGMIIEGTLMGFIAMGYNEMPVSEIELFEEPSANLRNHKKLQAEIWEQIDVAREAVVYELLDELKKVVQTESIAEVYMETGSIPQAIAESKSVETSEEASDLVPKAILTANRTDDWYLGA